MERSRKIRPECIKLVEDGFKPFGITQAQFADRDDIQVARSTVSKFFKGKPIDREIFNRICNVLKLNPEDITIDTQDFDVDNSPVDTLNTDDFSEALPPQNINDMAQEILIQTTAGETEVFHSVDAKRKAFGRRQDKFVNFIIPAGYVRANFSHVVEKEGVNAGGNVGWASADNCRDGTIKLHVWADGLSKATAKVWNVTAVRE